MTTMSVQGNSSSSQRSQGEYEQGESSNSQGEAQGGNGFNGGSDYGGNNNNRRYFNNNKTFYRGKTTQGHILILGTNPIPSLIIEKVFKMGVLKIPFLEMKANKEIHGMAIQLQGRSVS